MRDLILNEMDKENADGVDFVSIFWNDIFPPVVYCSMTREEVKIETIFPNSGRIYWRIIDNKKIYTRDLSLDKKNIRTEDFSEIKNLF